MLIALFRNYLLKALKWIEIIFFAYLCIYYLKRRTLKQSIKSTKNSYKCELIICLQIMTFKIFQEIKVVTKYL